MEPFMKATSTKVIIMEVEKSLGHQATPTTACGNVAKWTAAAYSNNPQPTLL